MSCNAEGALKWYCEECGDDEDLTIDHDEHADVGGFTIEGFHIHSGGEIVDLPAMYISINSMDNFKEFAKVMRAVRENVENKE
jgi:hypothetical protein